MENREVSALERLLHDGTDDDVRRFFVLLRPADLADLLETVPEDDRMRVVRLMGAPLRSEVLRAVQEGDRQEIFEDLSPEERAEIVHESRSDDAADLIGELPPEEKAETLERLEQDEREELEELLEYPEDTAGGIMQTEVVTARGKQTVEEAIAEVRGADMGDVGEIHEVFIVDVESRLIGAISPADLLQADAKAPLRSVIEPNPVAVPVTMDQEDIADMVRDHDLAAIPVIDAHGRLVGQILHDDVADVIEQEATEDIAKMAGTDPEEVYGGGVWDAVRSRVGWLVPPFLGGVLVAIFLGNSEKDIKQQPILAAYLVVVVGMAGGVGTQNAAITTRSLALGRVDLSHAWRFMFRQVLTGLILGLVFGALLLGFAMWREGFSAAAWLPASTLSLALFASMTWGALLGVAVPLVLERIGADPAIGASPFIQTANDVTGAGLMLGIARVTGLL